MNSVRLRFAVLACIALCTTVVAWSLWNQHPVMRRAAIQADKATEAAVRNGQEADPSVSSLPLLPTLVAPVLDQGVPVPVASATPESNDEPIKEVVAANRRAQIADYWNLTEEQTRALDIASEAPAEERLEVMVRFSRGEIAEKDFSAEMQAADGRGLQRVREVLGDEQFSEYVSIRGRLEADEPDMSPAPYRNN